MNVANQPNDRSRPLVRLAALAVLALSTGAFAQAPQPISVPSAAAPSPAVHTATPPQSFRQQYGTVTERNMFLRDRARPAPAARSPSSQPARLPEQSYVLTGIVFEGDQFRAYVEDRSRNTVVKLAAGDVVSGGLLTEITIDAIAYQRGGTTGAAWILVGQDFTGTTVIPVPAASTQATTGPSTGPADVPGVPSGLSAIEERMRQRRLQRR